MILIVKAKVTTIIPRNTQYYNTSNSYNKSCSNYYNTECNKYYKYQKNQNHLK